MQCPSCGFENPEGMKFCGECGNALKNICQQCGFENPPGFKFCGECGTPLTTTQQPASYEDKSTQTETPPPAPPTPDAERRQLTVMFSDLVDSTKLSGQLDPEEYREVLRAYQQTCAEVIYRFNGYIAQHLGDALLVYFGYPQAHEDEGQRAVRTGLGMVDAMKTLNERLEQEKGIRLSIRIGIHTGLTVISDVGSGQKHEMLALGEAPNVASRIQGVAEPDTVVISADSYRLVQGYFECQDLGEHSLKGVAEPQQVYRVIGESDTQSQLDIAATRGLTPLVGRESEVALLLERWIQVKDGQGQVVLLSGEGGIGKSRLVQVLKEHIANEPHTRWECRSSPYYQNTALYPVTDLFQRTLQWPQDDSPDEKLKKLEQTLRQYSLPLEEAVSLFAPLLLLPIPEDRYPPLQWSPQRQRQKTLESIVAILLEEGELQPVLFILEDLHWTDPSTLELLDLLIDQTPTTQILTLLTCRPAFQPPWSSRSYLTQMTLNRLSGNQIERMAEHIAGGKNLPTEVLQQIVEKTDGVPLFVEEMTKAVLESGSLKKIDGHYELVGPLTSLSIPATLQDSLMARLDRLVTAKGVAQLGATIGRTFSYELLQGVAAVDEATLQRELRRLVEAELLYQRGLPPQAAYTFKHALIQDTAYESLLRSTRQQYHQQIAQVLEERFPETAETQPELLARHCTEAGLTERAVAYCHQAGQRASQRSAHVEAIRHLRQGLALLVTLPETPARNERELLLLTTLGPALMATKGYATAEVEHVYGRARALCQQVEDSPQLSSVLVGLETFYRIRGELRTAQEFGEQMLHLAAQRHDATARVRAHRALGQTLLSFGEFVAARHHFEQGITLYESQPPALYVAVDVGVNCLCWLAWALWILGYAAQARQRSQEALARTLSHPHSLAYALSHAAIIHHLRREHHAVKAAAEATVAMSTEHGFANYIAIGKIMQGLALSAQLREEGLTLLRQGLTAYQATGARLALPQLLSWLAEAYGRAGQAREGLTAVTQALDLVDSTDERLWEAEVYRLKGELLLSSAPDNPTEAEACFRDALSIARRQQAKSLELRAATSLARLWQSQGKRQEAYDLLAPVYGWFPEGFDTADLKDAKALLEELG